MSPNRTRVMRFACLFIGIASLGLPRPTQAAGDTSMPTSDILGHIERFHIAMSEYRFDDALASAKLAYEQAKASSADPILLSETARYQAEANQRLRDDVQARNMMDWAIKHARDADQVPSAALVNAYIGAVATDLQVSEALATAKRAKKSAAKLYGKTSPEYVDALIQIGTNPLIESYEKSGDSDKATKHVLALASMLEDVPDQEIKPIYRVSPAYPQSALDRGQEGFVELKLVIDADGRVTGADVIGGELVSVFEDSARQAVAEWRFAPRIVDGKPEQRSAWVRLAYEMRE